MARGREGKMAIRLQRDGGLIFIHGAPEPKKRKELRKTDVLFGLIVLVLGALALGAPIPAWSTISHTFRVILAAVW